MLDVYFTIDTEFWPRAHDLASGDFADSISQDIDGHTPAGDFGVGFQLDRLNANGLRGVCFIEALSPFVVGPGLIERIVRQVRLQGHDAQLHLHTEWLPWMSQSILPGRTGQNMHDFTEEEQTRLVACGLQKLSEAGAHNICAFRAGNYGADRATLRALARNGLSVDSSYNPGYLDATCRIRAEGVLTNPAMMEGIVEYPVSCFQDVRGIRHTQLVACSSEELEYALLQAWRNDHESFVIVSHSHELIHRSDKKSVPARPNTVVVRRFERLCAFLSSNKDKFRTATFAEQQGTHKHSTVQHAPTRMKLRYTAHRYVEQIQKRLPW